MNGVTRPKEMTVVVDSDLSPAAAMSHECAHIPSGHIDDLAEYAQHRGLIKTEAESVAYVVAGLAGFDTSASSVGSIAGWAVADADLIKSSAARVLPTAHQIAGILTDEDEGTDDPEESHSLILPSRGRLPPNPGRQTIVMITYPRRDTMGLTIDPEGPAAAQSVDGAECGSETIDTIGSPRRCPRALHSGQDEHWGAYDRVGHGPGGAVAIALTLCVRRRRRARLTGHGVGS